MTQLIKIKDIAIRAAEAGFNVRSFNNDSYLEIFPPAYDGPVEHWYEGSCHVSANAIIISDDCNHGYGYNQFFFGPFHPGFCRADNYGLKKFNAALSRAEGK
jgi:hypothetical protein